VALADLTEADAERQAIDEFKDLGRDAFLEKYGFGPARDWMLVYDGEHYDSKAIVGAAHGFQYPSLGPLTPPDFTGGRNSTVAKLRSLGFEVVSLAEASSTSSVAFTADDCAIFSKYPTKVPFKEEYVLPRTS
jgi:hypothetical protein